MAISEGLRTSLNEIRETSIQNNTLYNRQIDEITPNTDISIFASQLFSDDNLMNEFFDVLIKRIVYTQIVDYKLFNNPLQFLWGDQMPLGAIGQEIFINPAKGRKFNVDDFAGLLARYEADIKVQYPHVNSDIQYPVTITREKLRNAFTSWEALEGLINGITQSLYNGAYIDRYNMTKGLVADAYNKRNVKIEVLDEPNTQAKAKAFLTKARTLYLNMQEPSSDYNAWKQVGGYGRDVITWTEDSDIVFLIRNDIGAYLDINVLADAFNLDKTVLLGRVKYVKDFNEYDKDGNVVIDGSKILGIMCDRSWFRIKNQETDTSDFFNPNNRTRQIYLDDVNMYQYSLFSNAIVFATQDAQVTITGLDTDVDEVEIEEGATAKVQVSTTPAQANTPSITVASSDSEKATATISGRTVTITGVADGEATVTITAGNVSTTVAVTVVDAS